MSKWAILAVALLGTIVGVAGLSRAANEPDTIKKVMKAAMGKNGLRDRVASGQADDGQKKELVKLFHDLAGATPPKGDPASWKAKTGALVAAAESAAAGNPGAGARLKQAADCKGCHSVHRSQ
jgi:hypothetical protein